MGLDMGLSASRYLSDYNNADKQKKEELLEMFPELKVYLTEEENPIQEVKAEVGYWRKANQIHRWFVENIQEGEDDCKSYYVSREKLQELKSLCQQVLENKSLANEFLPTQSGFFFGSTEYEGYYFDDLEKTIRIIDNALALPETWRFEYQSSW
jgi:hypothetical protein